VIKSKIFVAHRGKGTQGFPDLQGGEGHRGKIPKENFDGKVGTLPSPEEAVTQKRCQKGRKGRKKVSQREEGERGETKGEPQRTSNQGKGGGFCLGGSGRREKAESHRSFSDKVGRWQGNERTMWKEKLFGEKEKLEKKIRGGKNEKGAGGGSVTTARTLQRVNGGSE